MGCTDATAMNLEPLANMDDGSCIPFIFGCMDSLALNFNNLANTDDGSCCGTGLSSVPFGTQIGNEIIGWGETGYTVSMNDFGDIIAIYSRDHNTVQIFQINENNVWQQLGQNITGTDWTGWDISLNDIGNIIAVGEPGNDENGNNSGRVRIFNYDGLQWNQIGQSLMGEN